MRTHAVFVVVVLGASLGGCGGRDQSLPAAEAGQGPRDGVAPTGADSTADDDAGMAAADETAPAEASASDASSALLDGTAPDGPPVDDSGASSQEDASNESGWILQQLPPPTFSPPPYSWVYTPFSIVIQEDVPNFAARGGIIRYTTDGTTPTAAYGQIYTAPILIPTCNRSASLPLAIAVAPGYRTSPVAMVSYVIDEGPPGPLFNQGQLTWHNDFQLQLEGRCADALCYTTDRTRPQCGASGTGCAHGLTYDSASQILINGSVTDSDGNVTIEVVECSPNGVPSPVAEQTYALVADAPVMSSPPPGVLPDPPGGYAPTITSSTRGASIRYTTDGTNPTCTMGLTPAPDPLGTTDAGVISISGSTTIRAIACKTNYAASQVVEGTYTLLDDGGAHADQ
jgi:hypothetical protein